jgi:hypothetical protein
MCILHGLMDSPVSLYDEVVKINTISRMNSENFVAIRLENDQIKYFFYDFNKTLVEISS